MRILSFGEVLWDIYPEEKYIGGAPLNFAAHFVKQGGTAFLVSAVGNDELGRITVKNIRDYGVNTDYVNIVNNVQTGKCLVSLDENGVPSYNLLDNVAYDYIDCKISGEIYDALYFGTLALRNKNNRETINKIIESNYFNEIFADVNIRSPFYSKETVLFALENSTIIKISDEELPIVTSIALDKKMDYIKAAQELSTAFKNLKLVIITRGEKGSYLFDNKSKSSLSCNAIKIDVVSTVGAGDSFGAAFLYHYLNGERLDECLNFAAKISAFVVSNPAAIPEY